MIAFYQSLQLPVHIHPLSRGQLIVDNLHSFGMILDYHVVKYGLLGDAEFFDWLEINAGAILAGDPSKLAEAVRISCQAKADIVARDEKEQGQRALLNLGHTFAHALEAEAGYDGRLLHGEAVACGLRLAFGFSRHLGICSGQDEMRVTAHLSGLGLPSELADLRRYVR